MLRFVVTTGREGGREGERKSTSELYVRWLIWKNEFWGMAAYVCAVGISKGFFDKSRFPIL